MSQAFCRRSGWAPLGKTTVAIWWLIVHVFSGMIVVTTLAPTYRQVKRIAWALLKKLILPGARSRISEQELLIELPNGSSIQLHGADHPDSLRGVGLDFVVLDEYGSMRSETWTAVVRPMLSDKKGCALFIGTPKSFNCFYDLYVHAESNENWAPFRFATEEGGYVLPEELQPFKWTWTTAATRRNSRRRLKVCRVVSITPLIGN